MPPEERSATVRYVKQAESEAFFKEAGDSKQLREYLTAALKEYDPQGELVLCVAQPVGATAAAEQADPKAGERH